MTQQQPELNLKKILPLAAIVLGIMIVIGLWSRITVTVESGQAGVIFKLLGGGVDTD
ncbi:MAG: hypothetical protein GQ527_02920, partial [Bacteroidales bacterium]|nr:hypothetical protein [Bacteroidales bacterium]